MYQAKVPGLVSGSVWKLCGVKEGYGALYKAGYNFESVLVTKKGFLSCFPKKLVMLTNHLPLSWHLRALEKVHFLETYWKLSPTYFEIFLILSI